MVFAVLLLISVTASLIEKRHGYNPISRIVDILLMTIETALGCIIMYLLLFSHQVATSWNWLIIVFSPFPLIAWMLWRRRPRFYNVYLLFTAVLLIYCLGTPLIPQMQYASMPLLLLSFAVRTATRWMTDKKTKST